jgi:hypothetical protein
MEIHLPVGIIAHLTKKCGGNVYDWHVVDVTYGPFEKETHIARPRRGRFADTSLYIAKYAADLETCSAFFPTYGNKEEDSRYIKNNWVCCDFKERRIVPTHYTIHTNGDIPRKAHLKPWLVETSANGTSWREVALEEGNLSSTTAVLLARLRLHAARSADTSGW